MCKKIKKAAGGVSKSFDYRSYASHPLGEQDIVVCPEDAPDSLKDLEEPEDVDDVEYDTGEDEQVPHDTELVTRHRAVDRVDLIPVRRNARDTRQKESGRHREAVEQKQFRPSRIAHNIQEPPANETTNDAFSYCMYLQWTISRNKTLPV